MVTETIWLAKLRILPIWAFTEGVCGTLLLRSQPGGGGKDQSPRESHFQAQPVVTFLPTVLVSSHSPEASLGIWTMVFPPMERRH